MKNFFRVAAILLSLIGILAVSGVAVILSIPLFSKPDSRS